MKLHYANTVFIVLCNVIIGFASESNFKNSMVQSLESEKCFIGRYQPELTCQVKSLNNFVPHGIRCWYKSENHLHRLVCDKGFFYHVDGSKLRDIARVRRQTILKRYWKRQKRSWVTNMFSKFEHSIRCSIKDCDSGHSDIAPVVDRPPTINCPKVADVVAPPLDLTVQMNWTIPTTTDPENQHVSLSKDSGLDSGSMFREGTHSIVYKATDPAGNAAYCSITFQVTVYKCYDSLYIANGRAICDRNDKILGTRCTIVCDNGYELSNDSVTEKVCQVNGFSPGKTICLKKHCPHLSNPCYGYLLCSNGNTFGSVCYTRCSRGYEVSSIQPVICGENGWQGIVEDCKDKMKPVFTYCPSTIYTYSDSGRKRHSLTWNTLIVSDNSQTHNVTDARCKSPIDAPRLLQIEGLTNGSDFSVGTHNIKYKAFDGDGNEAFCEFMVIVEDLSCFPLMMKDGIIYPSCQTGYSVGSSCNLLCPQDFTLQGQSNVTCIVDPFDKSTALWEWTGSEESHCQRNPTKNCPKLQPPVNGALACSTVLKSEICTMSCNKQYQTPLRAPIDYVCTDGLNWNHIPQNCTRRRTRRDIVMKGDMHFYTGSCTDIQIQNEVKLHFVNVTKTQALTKDLCATICTIDKVAVTCGPILSGRRRRSSSSRIKKATHQITLSFEIAMPWSEDEDYFTNDERIQKFGNFIQNLSTAGLFDVRGIKAVDIVYSLSEMTCDNGSVPDYQENTCGGCAAGTYLKGEECKKCEKGYYQENEYSTSCIKCPPNQSTKEAGSRHKTDCQDVCQPGFYSSDGFEPCAKCPKNFYQPYPVSTSCVECEFNKITERNGANCINLCKEFDVEFNSPNSYVQLSPLSNSSSNDFTVGLWLKCNGQTDSFPILDITPSLRIEFGHDISYKFLQFSGIVNSSVDINDWNHFTVRWQKTINEVTVSRNGANILTKAFRLSNSSRHDGMNITLTSGTAAGCRISSFFLTDKFVRDEEVTLLSKTCLPQITGNIYSMKSFKEAISAYHVQLSLSTCDAINECNSNPCGEENICQNKIGGYTCVCAGGYSGKNCSVPPDFCNDNNCKNGASCLPLKANYSCVCANGYRGQMCEEEIVNGGWTLWTEWGSCLKRCNKGIKERRRFCSNPYPDSDGLPCIGDAKEQVECNVDPCPKCPEFISLYNHKNAFNCTSNKEYTYCTVGCQPGYVFLREYYPLGKYECGQNTSFQWNARPPACVEITVPQTMVAKMEGRYLSVHCEKRNLVETQLLNKLNNISCSLNSTCSATVSISECSQEHRQRRSNNPLIVSIAIRSDLNEGDMGMDKFYSTNIVSPALEKTEEVVNELVNSVTEISSDTDFFTAKNDNETFNIDPQSITLGSEIICHQGSVRLGANCAECPSGTFWKNGSCVICPKGTFQSLNRQLLCQKCPAGYTTPYIGSKNKTDCKVKGGWTLWTEWGSCSKTCNKGMKERRRFCSSPYPDSDGLPCSGDAKEQVECNVDPCPKCPNFISVYNHKNTFNCTSNKEYTYCTVGCQPGYAFLREYYPLEKYECGRNTSFQWNARPPACVGNQ